VLLVRFFALSEHISRDNGLIGMIQLGKVFVDVLAMRFACSIMQIDHWLPSYGVDLIADFVRATLTLRFSPNFGQNSK
jgi:hypothetical protein